MYSLVLSHPPLPGNLHFANIENGDTRNGQTYVCIVWNRVMRILGQGSDQLIEVQEWPGIDKPAWLLLTC